MISRPLHGLIFILLIVGGLNWGVYALTGWDVGQIFGPLNNTVAQIIYVLIGVAALVELLWAHKQTCKMCGTGK